MHYKDQEPRTNDLMERIQSGGSMREAAWRYIILQWGSQVVGTVIQRTGCDERQAREALSVASVGVDKRVRGALGQDFLQNASLKTYLTQSAIHAALSILKNKPKIGELSPADHPSTEEHENSFRSVDCAETMSKALECLGNRCKKILTLFNDDYSMEEISLEMGFNNADVARREKYKCQERFKTFLKEHPSIRKQLQENCYG